MPEDEKFIFDGPPTVARLASEIRLFRRDFRDFKEEIRFKWSELEKDERRINRFFDEWYGDKEENREGLGARVVMMVEEWRMLRWGGRLVMAGIGAIASSVGYLIARWLEHWR